jgi:hypothetical protein
VLRAAEEFAAGADVAERQLLGALQVIEAPARPEGALAHREVFAAHPKLVAREAAHAARFTLRAEPRLLVAIRVRARGAVLAHGAAQAPCAADAAARERPAKGVWGATGGAGGWGRRVRRFVGLVLHTAIGH